MKITKRNAYFGGLRLNFGLILAGLILIVGFVVWETRPTRVVTKKQADLISGIESRNGARIRRLVSDHYNDKWKFDGDDVVEAVVDIGSQFMTLVLTPGEQQIEVVDGEAIVVAHLIISGNVVGPGGGEVIRRINRLEEPFFFTWKKENFVPASWRLVQIHQTELPEELYGYEPGDIRRAMSGSEPVNFEL